MFPGEHGRSFPPRINKEGDRGTRKAQFLGMEGSERELDNASF